LALAVETVYGAHTLANYAENIGVEYHQLRNYKAVSQAYESAVRTANLSWSHHERIAAHPDRLEWLAKAAEGKWSVRRMLEEIPETAWEAAADKWEEAVEYALVVLKELARTAFAEPSIKGLLEVRNFALEIEQACRERRALLGQMIDDFSGSPKSAVPRMAKLE
jgi:hypothetical protein